MNPKVIGVNCAAVLGKAGCIHVHRKLSAVKCPLSVGDRLKA